MKPPLILENYDQSIHFEAVKSILLESHYLDTLLNQVLQEKLDDVEGDPKLSCVASLGSHICGFCLVVIRQVKGEQIAYIKLMGVAPAFQRSGVGTALLCEAEAFAKRHQAKRLRWYDVPKNYFMPGLDPFYSKTIAFVERNGFKRNGDAVNLSADLAQNWDTSSAELKLNEIGIKLKRASKADFKTVLDWIREEFPLWEYEVNNALNENPSAVHLAFEKENEWIGFAAFNGNNKGTAWFGPMGTSQRARRNGIGAVLLKRCLADLQKQGYKESIIPWVAPIPFYVNYANAKVNRVFWRYEKQI